MPRQGWGRREGYRVDASEGAREGVPAARSAGYMLSRVAVGKENKHNEAAIQVRDDGAKGSKPVEGGHGAVEGSAAQRIGERAKESLRSQRRSGLRSRSSRK